MRQGADRAKVSPGPRFVSPCSTPMTGIAGCCASAASGHAIAGAEKSDLHRCQLCPRKRTSSEATGMSALCHKRTYAPQQFTPSFNHVVDDGEHARRYREAEVLRCLQVDDQLEFGRLQHRQIGRLLALENSTGEDANLVVPILSSGAIADQPAGRDGIT